MLEFAILVKLKPKYNNDKFIRVTKDKRKIYKEYMFKYRSSLKLVMDDKSQDYLENKQQLDEWRETFNIPLLVTLTKTPYDYWVEQYDLRMKGEKYDRILFNHVYYVRRKTSSALCFYSP